METEQKSAEKRSISPLTVLGWIVGVLCLLGGLSLLFTKPFEGIFDILAGLTVFPPFWKFAKLQWHFFLGRALKIVFFIVFIIIAGVAARASAPQSLSASPTNVQAQKSNTPPVTTTPTITKAPTVTPKSISLEAKIKAALPDDMKDADVGVEDAAEIKDGAVTETLLPGEKSVILTEKLGTGFWDVNTAKEGVWQLTMNTIKGVFPTDKSIYSITLIAEAPVTTAYGKSDYTTLEAVTFTRETYNQIDFSGFDYHNIPTIADIYTENQNLK